MPTGTLVVSSGVSSINGTDLARKGAPKPFEAATNFIANSGFSGGDFVTVEGSNGNVGNVPVIFITAISAAKKSIKKAAKKSKKAEKKTAKKKTTKKSTKKSAKKSAKKR